LFFPEVKRHRGQSSWWNAQEDVQQVLALLVRRLDTELDTLDCEQLATVAWVLGKVKWDDNEVVERLFYRMMDVLTGQEEVRRGEKKHRTMDLMEKKHRMMDL
jgi:hypothetical protein